ncbi:hypothetical protein ANTQUA_LOCUS2971 [Anthophora quadrimaculata]
MQSAPRSIYRTHRSAGRTTRRSSYILATLEDGTLLGNGVFSRISYNNAIPAMLDAYLAMQHAPRSIYGIPRCAGITGRRRSYMLGLIDLKGTTTRRSSYMLATLEDGTLPTNGVFSRSSYNIALPAMLDALLAMQSAPRSIHGIPRSARTTIRRSSYILATLEDATLARNCVFSRSSYSNAIPAMLCAYLAMQHAPRSIYGIPRCAGITGRRRSYMLGLIDLKGTTTRRSSYMLATLEDGTLPTNGVFSRSSYNIALPAMLDALLAMQSAPRSIHGIPRSARTTTRRSSYILATLEDATLARNCVFSRSSYSNAIPANLDA